MELKENGDVILTSTHVNPVFFGSIDEELKALKNNKSIKLNDQDVFSLTQTNFKYQIKLTDIDLTKLETTNGESANTNGNGEAKVTKEKPAKDESEQESDIEEKPSKKTKKQQVFV